MLTFEEPAASANAAVSLYGASPSMPQASFGTFKASTGASFKQLGSARFGTLATVSLGKSAPDVGGYAGKSSSPLGKLTPSQINSFDLDNVLPFQRQSRLSLFLFDPKSAHATRLREPRPMKFTLLFLSLMVAAGIAVAVSGCGSSGPAPMGASGPPIPPNATPAPKLLYVDHNGIFDEYRLPLTQALQAVRTLAEWPGLASGAGDRRRSVRQRGRRQPERAASL